ncbi:MAG: hypothetical protein SVV03_01140 [Candidatus Nanohaloarchaea archaeon]|nr:hypothetical protein [Candidatus Nanohaloarchaea archaeon]
MDTEYPICEEGDYELEIFEGVDQMSGERVAEVLEEVFSDLVGGEKRYWLMSWIGNKGYSYPVKNKLKNRLDFHYTDYDTEEGRMRKFVVRENLSWPDYLCSWFGSEPDTGSGELLVEMDHSYSGGDCLEIKKCGPISKDLLEDLYRETWAGFYERL